MDKSTDWVPSLWKETFDQLLNNENELESGEPWSLRFNYSQTNPKQRKGDWKVYSHCANGNFQCGSCRKSWSSARVVVVFRYRLRDNRGTVIMWPFAQACRRCKDDKYYLPGFSKEDVEEALHRLIRKIRKNCYGEDVDGSVKGSSESMDRTKPHEASLCQACIMGIHCQGAE